MNTPTFTTPFCLDWLCLDIETSAGRPESADEWMRRQWSPDSRWTPDTIGKRYLDALEKKRHKLALLDAAAIVVIAANYPGGRLIMHTLSEHALKQEDFSSVVGFANERDMLMHFRDFAAVAASEGTLLVGHNIRAFDLPRLRLAFLRNGLQLPAMLSANQPHFDSMKEFCRAFSVERSEMIGLPEVLQKLGLPNHKEMVDGSQIDQLIAKGEHETLLRYSALDVCQESEVFLRMTGRSASLQ